MSDWVSECLCESLNEFIRESLCERVISLKTSVIATKHLKLDSMGVNEL